MNIMIDTSSLLINPTSGLSEVIRNLISEIPFVENENQFTLFYNYFRSINTLSDLQFPGTQNYVLRAPRRLVNWSWNVGWPSIDNFLPETHIYHSLHVQIPPSVKVKRILTVHDCRFLALHELYPPRVVNNYQRLMNISLQRVDMVATVSNYTKQELLTHFSIPEDKVKVIYNGFRPYVSEAPYWEENMERFMELNNLPPNYLLFAGVLDPRKNLDRLIEALYACGGKTHDFPDLVIAGVSPKQWADSDQAKRAGSLGILNHIHTVGVVSKDILWGIMQKAVALCYPSIYEGFGFPPLEAMSLGVPVLAAQSSAIPETSGDAACLVDPMSVDDIARGIQRIIFDSEYRQKLIDRGYAQIKKFSWQQAAREYIQLYKEVLAS
jgi:glycosyltransferase involved in cell wall biosynthesis